MTLYFERRFWLILLVLGLASSKPPPRWESSKSPNNSWLWIISPAKNETLECTDIFLTLERNMKTDPGSVFMIFVDRGYVSTGSLPRQMQSTTISLRPLKPGNHLLQIFSADVRPPVLLDEVPIMSSCQESKQPFSEPSTNVPADHDQCSRSEDATASQPVYLISRIPPLALNPIMPELRGPHPPVQRLCLTRVAPRPSIAQIAAAAACAVMHGPALLRFARQSGPYEEDMVLDWLGVRTNRSLEDCQATPAPSYIRICTAAPSRTARPPRSRLGSQRPASVTQIRRRRA